MTQSSLLVLSVCKYKGGEAWELALYPGRTRLETGRIKILLANSSNGGSGRGGALVLRVRYCWPTRAMAVQGGGALVLREQSLRQAGLDIAGHLHTWVAIVGQGNCWYGKGEEPR